MHVLYVGTSVKMWRWNDSLNLEYRGINKIEACFQDTVLGNFSSPKFNSYSKNFPGMGTTECREGKMKRER